MSSIKKRECGQATVEFTVVLVMLLGVSLTLMFLLTVFAEYGWRVISLVALEYP